MLGIKRFFSVAANIVVNNSAVLVTTGLLSAIAAGEQQKLRWWVPFSVGATGGVRAQIVVPAAVTLFQASILLVNTVAPSLTSASQAASAAFTNAAANAGTHWFEINLIIINGVNAGNVDLQMAQNTADALSMTILKGGSLDVTTFS